MIRRKFIQKIAKVGTLSAFSAPWVFNIQDQISINSPSKPLKVNPTKKDWQNLTSVEDMVNTYPERIQGIMKALNPQDSAVEDVNEAWKNGSPEKACQLLLKHYQENNRLKWLKDQPVNNKEEVLKRANDVLNDIYYGYGDKGKVPRLANGHLDWTHRGPNNDRQFANRLNRHGHLQTLLHAYQLTNEKKYLKRLDLDLRDWLIAAQNNPVKDGFGTSHLGPANRLPRWSEIFFSLQDEREFHEATRLLLLSAIPIHGNYLIENTGHGNWVAMTQYGALTCGVCWPEFKKAGEWRIKSVEQLVHNANSTVYPDGAQKELTATYHMVTLDRYDQVYDLLDNAGYDVPPAFSQKIKDMWNYTAYIMRPDGTLPLNNDADLITEQKGVLEAASKFDRPDWQFIATNGKQGKRPAGLPSRCFPWAGQMVSRNGWDVEAHWGFFDFGPCGMGHRHFDFGHLSINAYGRPLLVDSGRFAYQGKIAEQFRTSYAQHTRGHNTILIDGQSQGNEPEINEKPYNEGQDWQITDQFDFACGSWSDFENIDNNLKHYRATLYLKNRGWIIVDRIETARTRKIQPLWHFHPDCTIQTAQGITSTDHGKGNLKIMPVSAMNWDVSIIKGKETPEPQGWYSREYGEYQPAPCAQYTGHIERSTTFAWLIWPGEKEVQLPQAALESITDNEVTINISSIEGKEEHSIQIPIKGGKVDIS